MALINLQGTDIVQRIRRFTRAVGAISPTLPDQMQGVLSLLDLSIDPYQTEWNGFGQSNFNAGVAGDQTIIGLSGVAPATLIVGADIILGAANQQCVINVNRPNNLATVAAGAAPTNNGGRGQPSTFIPQARAITTNQVASPGGSTVDVLLVDTLRSFQWIPPIPIVLYGPAFNGSNPTNTSGGDAIYFTNNTLAAALRVTIYWKEYPNFQPN